MFNQLFTLEELNEKEKNQLFTGLKFKEKFPQQMIKLTNRLENHNGFQFKTGLNVDFIPFNPKVECQPGGIYFCSIENIFKWLNYSNSEMIYYR